MAGEWYQRLGASASGGHDGAACSVVPPLGLARRVRQLPPAVARRALRCPCRQRVLGFLLCSGRSRRRTRRSRCLVIIAAASASSTSRSRGPFRRESHAFSRTRSRPSSASRAQPCRVPFAWESGERWPSQSRTVQPDKLMFNLANTSSWLHLADRLPRHRRRGAGAPGAVEYLAPSRHRGGDRIAHDAASAITLSGAPPSSRSSRDAAVRDAGVRCQHERRPPGGILLWSNPAHCGSAAAVAPCSWPTEPGSPSARSTAPGAGLPSSRSSSTRGARRCLLSLLDTHVRCPRRDRRSGSRRAARVAARSARPRSTVSRQRRSSPFPRPSVRSRCPACWRHDAPIHSARATPGGREVPIRQAMVAPLVASPASSGCHRREPVTEGTAFGRDDSSCSRRSPTRLAVASEWPARHRWRSCRA